MSPLAIFVRGNHLIKDLLLKGCLLLVVQIFHCLNSRNVLLNSLLLFC